MKRRSDNRDDIEHSTFFVAHWTYHRICMRQKDKLVVERGLRDWRMLFQTPYGIVYIEADGSLQNENQDDAGPIEVEWGNISYERCIENAEEWMKRANERKPSPL